MVLIALGTFTSLNAQSANHIRSVELKPFNHVQLQNNSEIILIKSTRNYMFIQGDSAEINDIAFVEEDGILGIDILDSAFNSNRIVIEFTELNYATTGGNGEYYILNIDEDFLSILNPQATLTISGSANNFRLTSDNGYNDLSSLETKKDIIFVEDVANLVSPTKKGWFFARRD